MANSGKIRNKTVTTPLSQGMAGVARLQSQTHAVLRRSKKLLQHVWLRAMQALEVAPLLSFFTVFGLLIGVVTLSSYLRKPVPEPSPAPAPARSVSLFPIGAAPSITFSGRVEHSGSLRVISSVPGYVQRLEVKPGMAVKKGQRLLWISNTPQGGTVASVSRLLAQKNWELVEANYPDQQRLLELRRQTAETVSAQSDELREITKKSLDDTRTTIAANEDLLRMLDAQLKQLEAGDPASNSAALLQTKQGRAGILAALTSLRAGLRASEYQSSDTSDPTNLSHISRELTLKQLDMERRSLDLGREVAQLNLRIAQIQESLQYPASPCVGTVERVLVRVGQSINPGTPLFALRCQESQATVVVLVPHDTAVSISRLEQSTLHVGGEHWSVYPQWVSLEPTDGSLHSIQYLMPAAAAAHVSDGSWITVSVPVGAARASASVPYIPVDAMYQSATQAYVMVAVPEGAETARAQVRVVKPGKILGDMVEIQEGLQAGDIVLVDRSVVGGDEVFLNANTAQDKE